MSLHAFRGGLTQRTAVAGSSSRPASAQTLGVDPIEKTRKNLGYKDKWGRKEVDLKAQHSWAHPLPDKPVVAIIGGGLSGLACAGELAQQGIRSVVFDTGKSSVGGRLATRSTHDGTVRAFNNKSSVVTPGYGVDLGKAGLMFDHAAQMFTVTDPRFRSLVDRWLSAKAVKSWDGIVGTLTSATTPPSSSSPLHPPQSPARPSTPTPPQGGIPAHQGSVLQGSGTSSQSEGGVRKAHFTPFAAPGSGQQPERYVGSNGMRGLAQFMENQLLAEFPHLVEVRRPVWVGKMQASDSAGGWVLSGEGRAQGTFDFVVISHNGKCANRLVGPTGAPLVAQQLMSLRLNAVWALMVAFRSPLLPGFDGAFVKDSPTLSWASSNTRKLGLSHTPEGLDCWTLISSAEFGARNKVPQEAVPEEVHSKIAEDLLDGLAADLGLVGGRAALPPVVYSRAQLWGAALPMNSPGVECIVDPYSRVGVCGDWLLGRSMQAAAVSGIALARRIAKLRGVAGADKLQSHEIGVRDTSVRPAPGSAIGAFPGMPASMVSGSSGQQATGQFGRGKPSSNAPRNDNRGQRREQPERIQSGRKAPVMVKVGSGA